MIMINKATEKDFTINIVELQIIMNLTVHKMSGINYKALKKVHIINSVES